MRWYLSAKAVREYAAIRRLRLDDGGPLWAAAERALSEVCDAAQRAHRADGSRYYHDDGCEVWHVGRAHGRLRLVVSTARRPEGDLPQLVAVLRRSGR